MSLAALLIVAGILIALLAHWLLGMICIGVGGALLLLPGLRTP